jgi:hypothetical protein
MIWITGSQCQCETVSQSVTQSDTALLGGLLSCNFRNLCYFSVTAFVVGKLFLVVTCEWHWLLSTEYSSTEEDFVIVSFVIFCTVTCELWLLRVVTSWLKTSRVDHDSTILLQSYRQYQSKSNPPKARCPVSVALHGLIQRCTSIPAQYRNPGIAAAQYRNTGIEKSSGIAIPSWDKSISVLLVKIGQTVETLFKGVVFSRKFPDTIAPL